MTRGAAHPASEPPPLDAIDRRLIEALLADGRLPVAALAERIGLSKTPTLARMRRLERAGIIRGYRALVDPARIGMEHVAFVEVKLDDTREPALTAFNAAVRAVREVESCHMIAGAFDYLLKVRTRDIRAYRRALAERISTLPHVAATATHVAMESVKEP